ncbi:hypothetical protein SAMN05880574_11187 [Chryseobacterium sp. RU37D]|nr:hypothetical protein SAMN05880574_11187 [Chryseobacterium sp. RU37D]
MKNLRKLSRNELKDMVGGRFAQNMSVDVAGGNCWVHEKNGTLTGTSSDYGQSGGGKCPTPPSGYHCKSFTAMGGC